MNDIDLPATTIILNVISPLLVALIRRCTWPSEFVAFLSLVVVALCFTLGQFLDGRLTFPLPESFWVFLLAAWGGNQFLYKFVYKGTKSIDSLERVGNKA
jgi:hypothetical protein